MLKTLPGSTIEADITQDGIVDSIMRPMFMGGGLMLSQISQISGLEPYIIQNWVKRGYLAPPVGKKYTRSQLCRILHINMLRESMQIEKIVQLLTYINGSLSDSSDDTIDDSDMYVYFVKLAAKASNLQDINLNRLDEILDSVLENYREPYSGARKRLKNVLKTMFYGYTSAELKKDIDKMMSKFDTVRSDLA